MGLTACSQLRGEEMGVGSEGDKVVVVVEELGLLEYKKYSHTQACRWQTGDGKLPHLSARHLVKAATV
jgi:hypothetical protein